MNFMFIIMILIMILCVVILVRCIMDVIDVDVLIKDLVYLEFIYDVMGKVEFENVSF